MEINQKINHLQDDSSESNLDFRELVEKYFKHWKWFILSIIICLFLAFLNLNFQTFQYKATSSIKIKDEKGGDKGALSAFQDLGVMMGSSNDNIEDEIEILKSKGLISEVIKSLNLNIQFFTNKNYISDLLDSSLGMNTEFYETENYSNPPLKINFLINDSILYNTSALFVITINSENEYTYYNIEKSINKKQSFGEKITTDFGDIIITPNVDLKNDKLIGSKVLVNINSVRYLVHNYIDKIEINALSDFSHILNLSITSGVKKKAEDFLNELVRRYNGRSIRLKEELTRSTSDFVTKRLEIISDELSTVDLTAETLKTRYGLSDAASNAGLNMESGQLVENQIVQTTTQLEKIGYIKDFVATKDANELIPVDIGVGDNNVSTSMQQYNALMMEKKRLLEHSTEKNPIVVNINEQLRFINDNIKQGLNNAESSQQISLDALNRQDARINSRLYSAPKQERQYRDIQRQQQIKEQLYLYLLQKREETAITLGVADSNAKIINFAESLYNPISPKTKLTYLAAIFLGLLIPLGVVYLSDVLDSKIHTREDVEKALTIPIIGDIPKIESKNRFLIKSDDYSSAAEAFRILRTNLNFVLPDIGKEYGKIIFVTSSIAHEGKSLVATNLAVALAHANKHTLLLGMDIRAPGLKPYIGIRGKMGVTNYIINANLTPQDVLNKVPDVDNLDVISSGDIAPNPAELLMNPRVEELINFARKNYDYVIVDTAAFSMVTDTLLLSQFADAFIYVIRANFLDKRMLKYIKFLYKEKRIPNISLLINGIDLKKSYGYGYGYGYGTSFEKSKKKSWWKLNT